jgi:imidazolonepropionase-like amidohydrolase
MRTERIGLALAWALGICNFAPAQDTKKADAKKPGPVTAIVGADIYTVTKGVIKNGVVLVQDGKILKVGQDVAIPDGATRIDAKGKFITPGFVTVSASNVGIRAAGGPGGGGGGPPVGGAGGITGRIADSLNPLDRNILFCLASGITTACVETTGGGGGRGGRSDDPIPDDTNVCPCCGMTFLPTEPIGPVAPAERVARRHAVLKMTYGDMAPMLVSEAPFYHVTAGSFVGPLNRHQWRETIKRAKQQVKDQAGADPDDPAPGFGGGAGRGVTPEVLRLVEKKIPLRVDAASVEQMRDMIALAKELDYNIVLEGVQEAWLIAGELKKGNVQAILTPRSRRRPSQGKEDTTGSSIETSGELQKAAVPFAVVPLGTSVSLDGIPGRDLTSLMLEAAYAVRGGASEQTALEALTITPAKMIGLDKKIGSIEEGKDADLLILNGPPLDYRTHIDKAIVVGKVYYDRLRERIYPDLPNR